MASTPNRSTSTPARLRPLVNTLIVAGGYFLSRLLGLIRDLIISYQFGTSRDLDAYRATFGILDMIYLVVAGGALGTAFIPIFAGLLEQRREDDAWRLASSILNLAFLALLVTCALVALLADPLVALTVGSGFDPQKRALTVSILRLLLIQPILLGVGGLAKATLESFDQFTLPAVGANLYNLGIIGGALLAPWLGIAGLVWGVVVGAALFLLVQVPGLRRVGFRYRPVLRRDTPGAGQVARLLGPRLFGQSAWQLNMIAIGSFATTLAEGSVAANGYAYQLMLLPHGLLALSLGTVIFPRLARHHAAGDLPALRAAALGAIRNVLFLALPAGVGLAALRLPLLRMLFQRGEFDWRSTALTAEALGYYALGLAAFAVAEILVRTFYAMRDTRTPVYIGVGMVLLNIALGWGLLRAGMGLGGLALAFSVSSTAEAIALLLLLGPRLGGLGGLAGAIGRMMVAALLCGAALLALLWLSQPALPFLRPGDTYRWPADFIPLALWLLAAAAVAAAAYGAAAALLRLEELRTALERLAPLWARVRNRG